MAVNPLAPWPMLLIKVIPSTMTDCPVAALSFVKESSDTISEFSKAYKS